MNINFQNYHNIFVRVYRSFFCKNYYNFIAKQKNTNGFALVCLILAITYLIPCLIIQNRLSNFTYNNKDNKLVVELKENLYSVPDIYLNEGKLLAEKNPNLPYNVNSALLGKNILLFDPSQNSLIANNSIILFSQDRIYFYIPELIYTLLKIINLSAPTTGKFNNKSDFILYPKDNIKIDGKTIISWTEKYIRSLGKTIIYPILPIIILLSVILKFIEIWFLSLITKFIANNYKLNFTSRQAFRLTATALIPTLIIKLLNAMTLWSSNILSTYPLSTLLLLTINLYYIYFAVKSVAKNKE